jgi:hypothetical protein
MPNINNLIDWDEPLRKEIKSNTEILDMILSGLNRDFKFYILGGSQLNLFQNKSIDFTVDIDLFFPNKEEYLKLKGALINKGHNIIKDSDFATTFNINNFNVQLIKFNFGTPEEICETFDLNKSRIGIIVNGNSVIKYMHETFNEELYIDYSNFRNSTPKRFLKYIRKIYDSTLTGVEDLEAKYSLDNKILEIVEYLIENRETKYLDYYCREGKIKGEKILKIFLNKILSYSGYVINREVIIDKILKDFSNLPIRKQIQFWDFLAHPNYKFPIFQKDIILMSSNNKDDIKNVSKEFRQKHPQFFI